MLGKQQEEKTPATREADGKSPVLPSPPPPHGRGQLIDVLMLQTAEASGRKWFR